MSEKNLEKLLEYLAKAAMEVANGDYRAASEIFELTKTGKYPAGITDLAEAFGMMLVRVEAREHRLEHLIDDLSQKKLMLEAASRALQQANLGVLEVLGSAIAKRDHGTSAHNYRVTFYAFRLGSVTGHPDEEMKSLIKGAFLHDVGKIGISDAILLKEGSLTGHEFEIMKRHVRHGSEIIGAYPWLQDCLDVVVHHHEKFDGTGYIEGLKGHDIPKNARIFAVADVFDALTSARPYKPALTFEESMKIMQKASGTHFDPEIIAALCEIGDNIYSEIYQANDEALRNVLKIHLEKLFDTKTE